jgi:hypothetical protein
MLIVLLTEWRIKHRCITLENIKFVNYEKIKKRLNCIDGYIWFHVMSK